MAQKESKLLLEDEFLSAPNEAVFFNPVPSLGFRLAREEERIPVSTVYPEHGDCSDLLTVRALPKEGERGSRFIERLLIPLGEIKKSRNPFFDEGDTPLFERFAALEGKGAIMAFANQYGELRYGVGKKSGVRLPEEDYEFFETLDFWEEEIREVREFLVSIKDYEEKRFAMGKHEEELQNLASIFNKKLRQNPCSEAYRVEPDGKVTPVLVPHTLAGAIWLQLAQSFFKDGPTGRLSERCHICGKYGKRDGMSQRKNGPSAGRYYHRSCDHMLTQRKYRERKAISEGRVLRVKKDRKKTPEGV